MNIILKEQRARIQELWNILESIRQEEMLFSDLDPNYLKEKRTELITKYAERLTDLFNVTFEATARHIVN